MSSGPAPYFDNCERIARLIHAASSWHGTPFVAHGAVRGAGVDCVQLCAEIYKECGALEVFDPPNYTMDGGRHLKESLVIQWVESSGRFARCALVLQPAVGDLLCFKIGSVGHHCGIAIGGQRFVQSLEGQGVVFSTLEDSTWQKRLSAIYRPKAL